MQTEAVLHDVADFQHLFRNLFWHINLKFHPVGIFHEAQSLEVLLIVGIVVDGGLCTQLVETLNQATFGVHVGEAERSGELRHAFAFRPVNHCTIERIHHFLIVDEIDKTKATSALPVRSFTNLLMMPAMRPTGLPSRYAMKNALSQNS